MATKKNNAQTDRQRLEAEEFEDAQIMFRNFSGRPTPYNAEGGKRDFCIRIDDEARAEDLKSKGWYVKEYLDRETGEVVFWYLRVSVSYRFSAPEIYQVVPGTNNMVALTESTVGNLDHADIESCDIRVTPSVWNMNGRSGVKAYLQEMTVVPRPSRIAQKYQNYRVVNADDRPVDANVSVTTDYDEDIPF